MPMSNQIITAKPEEPEPGKWWVYIIETAKGTYYTGITTDVTRRWAEHRGESSVHGKSKGAKYFRSQKPKAIVYLEDGHDRSTASRREAGIKKFSRERKVQLVSHHAGETQRLKVLLS